MEILGDGIEQTSKDTKVTFSTIMIRNDDLDIQDTVNQTNDFLVNLCKYRRWSLINNNNVGLSI